MLDIMKLSDSYTVRQMLDPDAADILALCMENTQYYQTCGKLPSIELILHDLHVTPPGVDPSAKHYVGFFDGAVMVAVMDLIEGYPDADGCFIGFFMMNRQLQGRQIGSGIIGELCRNLKAASISVVMLGIDKNNPQAAHFWKKNGFCVVGEVEQDGGTILVARRTL